VPIQDQALRRRFEWKRDQDMSEITSRMDQITVERAYRIVGALEKRAQEIREFYVPKLRKLIATWRDMVLKVEAGIYGGIALLAGGLQLAGVDVVGGVQHMVEVLTSTPWGTVGLISVVSAIVLGIHFATRTLISHRLQCKLMESNENNRDRLARAFKANTRFWRSIFETNPVGWSRWNRRRVKKVIAESDHYVQTLNDSFTDPSGLRGGAVEKVEEKPDEDTSTGENALSGEVIRPVR